MNDVRKFIRYTLPGLVFTVELLIALFLSHDICTLYYIINLPSSIITSSTLGVVFGGFLASGALGYLFSLIYWALYNQFFIMDFLSIFKDLENRNIIELIDQRGSNRISSKLTKNQGWVISSQYWCHQKENSDQIKGIDPYLDRLVDITHGIGTTFVATIFSLLFWMYIRYTYIFDKQDLPFFSIITLSFWIILFLAIIVNYLRMRKIVEELTNSTILNEIMRKFNFYYNRNNKIIINFIYKMTIWRKLLNFLRKQLNKKKHPAL